MDGINLFLNFAPTNKQSNNLKVEPRAVKVIISRAFVMEKYNYFESVKSDILDYINDHDIQVYNSNRDEIESSLYDDLFIADSVTGNASGSYTFNAWQAEENLCHNFDLLQEACSEFGSDLSVLDSPESCDVTIRCYLLSQCLSEALDEVEQEDPEEDIEEEDDDNA